jgi:flavodoxin-like protein
MKALVIYESMYGNTREIAEAIAAGIGESADVHLVPTVEALDALTENPDLVVMGGPTHGHGMSRARTRQTAIADGNKPGSNVRVDPHADGPGIRDLLESIKTLDAHAAAFDTRTRMPAWLSGRAAKGIARALERRGARMVAAPESFFVNKDTSLVAGETDRARRWGAQLTENSRALAVNAIRNGEIR